MKRMIKASEDVKTKAELAAKEAKEYLEGRYPVEIEIFSDEDGHIVLNAIAKSSDFTEDEGATWFPYDSLENMSKGQIKDDMIGSVESTLSYVMGYGE